MPTLTSMRVISPTAPLPIQKWFTTTLPPAAKCEQHHRWQHANHKCRRKQLQYEIAADKQKFDNINEGLDVNDIAGNQTTNDNKCNDGQKQPTSGPTIIRFKTAKTNCKLQYGKGSTRTAQYATSMWPMHLRKP